MEVRIGSFESARRAASYLGERSRDELRAFDADPVVVQVQRFQWGADHTVKKRAEGGKPLVLRFWASGGHAECSIRQRASFSLPADLGNALNLPAGQECGDNHGATSIN